MIHPRGLALFAIASMSLLSSRALAECVALEGGRLALPGARPASGTVVMRDGKIVSAGPDASVPADCRRVSALNKTITAGFIDPAATTGVAEIDLEPATVSTDAGGTDPVRAAFRVADGYDPRASTVAVSRMGGVTSAVIEPVGGTVSGQSAWVDFAGATQAEAVRRAPVAVAVQLSTTVGSSLRMLRELLDDAKRFVTQRDAWERGQSRQFPWSRLDLEALQPVIEGKIPLVIGADRSADVEAVLRLASEMKIRIVIRGGAEAHLVAAQLARAGVGVIVDPYLYGPAAFSQARASRNNAARLHQAGVTVAISSFSAHNLRRLRQLAGNAVREGLPWETALRAITAAPAELFGMEGYGVLAPGAIANVAVWNGDPLEIATQLEQVFVHGTSMPMRSRQTELLERYRKLPGSPAPALSLP